MLKVRRPEIYEFIPDGPFDDDVLAVVLFKDAPFVRRIFRVIPGPAAVGLRRLARKAEVADERLAARVFLPVLIEVHGLSHGGQVRRIRVVQREDAVALPLFFRQVREIFPEAVDFKVRVERGL